MKRLLALLLFAWPAFAQTPALTIIPELPDAKHPGFWMRLPDTELQEQVCFFVTKDACFVVEEISEPKPPCNVPHSGECDRLAAVVLDAPQAAAQTNHAYTNTYGTAISVAFTNPQLPTDTLYVSVPEGGVLSSAAGETWTKDCTTGSFAIYHAPALAEPSNVITYTVPAAGYLWIMAQEQPGLVTFDSCGIEDVSTTGAQTTTWTDALASPVSPTEMIYAVYVDTGEVGIRAGAGFSILNGRAASYWGASTFTGPIVDEFGAGQNPSFVLPSGMGADTGTILAASYISQTAPQPVTLTFGPSTSALMPCTDVVSYDDGTPLFPGGNQTFTIMQQEGAAQVAIGTPTIGINGQVTGTVIVNPNYTVNGQVLIFATIGGIAGLPQIAAQPFDPRQLQQGSTGICIGVVLFKSITLPKYSVLGLTP